jgi:hypothetical protein
MAMNQSCVKRRAVGEPFIETPGMAQLLYEVRCGKVEN